MQIEDDDPLPMTGKLKGGPKKATNLKPTAAKKVAMPKGEKGGGKGFKAPKAGKISAKIGHTKVAAHPSEKKAENRFAMPKPAMPKKTVKKGRK